MQYMEELPNVTHAMSGFEYNVNYVIIQQFILICHDTHLYSG